MQAHVCARASLRTHVHVARRVTLCLTANLRRYGISVDELAAALTSDPRVHAFSIFIASLFDEAERLASALPFGRSKVCRPLSLSLLQFVESQSPW